MVIARLARADSRSWEVYREGELIGLLHADDITPGVDARCHFIFFDHALVDKREMCRATMAWLFHTYDLHVLRVEVPTYASKLAGFARKALSFKYEAESRPFTWPSSAQPLTLEADEARLVSRKHHAIFHAGRWHDLLLLSITREEFSATHDERGQKEGATSDRTPPKQTQSD